MAADIRLDPFAADKGERNAQADEVRTMVGNNLSYDAEQGRDDFATTFPGIGKRYGSRRRARSSLERAADKPHIKGFVVRDTESGLGVATMVQEKVVNEDGDVRYPDHESWMLAYWLDRARAAAQEAAGGMGEDELHAEVGRLVVARALEDMPDHLWALVREQAPDTDEAEAFFEPSRGLALVSELGRIGTGYRAATDDEAINTVDVGHRVLYEYVPPTAA